MKKIFCIVLAVLCLISVSMMTVSAVDNVNVYVNGKLLETDQPAVIYQDRTLLPMRAICEALKCEVDWDNVTRTATIENPSTIMAVQINAWYMSKMDREDRGNMKSIPLDVPAMTMNDRTMLPVRAVAEALNAEVIWDGATQSVYVNMPYDTIDDFWFGYAEVSKNGLRGVIDENRNVVIPLEYQEFNSWWPDDNDSTFEGGETIAFFAKKNGKWGIINQYNEVLLNFEYDEPVQFWNDEYTVAKKNGKFGYINRDGKIVIPFEYELASEFDYCDVALAKKNGKFGFINKQGKNIISFVYDEAEPFDDGIEVTNVKKNGKWGSIDQKGKVIHDFVYDEIVFFDGGRDITTAKKNDKWGYIDNKGNVLIDFIYDEADLFYDQDVATVKKNGIYGCIDRQGNTVIPFIYEELSSYDNGLGRFVAKKNGKYGFINKKGNTIVPFVYEELEQYSTDGYSWEETDEGSIVTDYNYMLALAKKDNKYGYIDLEGNVVIPFVYDFAGNFWLDDEVFAYVIKDGKYNILNTQGALKYSSYIDFFDFSEGLALVEMYGKYGYINTNGQIVIPCEYYEAKSFVNGYALVKKDNEWIYIDKNGSVVK